MDIYHNASRLGVYPPLFTSPSGDSCINYCYECIHYYELFIFLNECIVASSLRLFKANETNYGNKLESHLPGSRLAGYHVQAQQQSWTRDYLKQIWAGAQGRTWTQDIRILSLAPEPLCHTTSFMNLYLIAWPEVLQCQWSTAQEPKEISLKVAFYLSELANQIS